MRNAKTGSSRSAFGLDLEFCGRDEDDEEEVCSIVDIEGMIDYHLIPKMKKFAKCKPADGLPGFTAQYHPDLWLAKSENDDIGFWIGRRQVALIGRIANLPYQSPNIVREILKDIELLRLAPSTPEDRAAQNLAMTVGEFALDPMHALFRRKDIKLAGSFSSNRKLQLTYLHS